MVFLVVDACQAFLALDIWVLFFSCRMQAIDALALCDVDGRLFLEMDEEDLAESDELGLDVRRNHVGGSGKWGRVGYLTSLRMYIAHC